MQSGIGPDMAERYPAYVVGAWHNGAPTVGPQCSARGEWCFACTHMVGGPQETDVLANIKSLIRVMIAQRKELPTIVLAVEELYNDTGRPHTTFTTPSGITKVSPAWSKNSISAHIVFSTEFPELYHNVIVQCFQSMLMQLNAKMLTADGEVDEHTRKAFLETTAALAKWNATTTAKKIKL